MIILSFFLCQMAYTLIFKVLRPSLLVVSTNAPGRSCFKPVKRAMAFLNYPIGSVTLPVFFHGIHLINGEVYEDSKEVEQANFTEAMEILAEL